LPPKVAMITAIKRKITVIFHGVDDTDKKTDYPVHLTINGAGSDILKGRDGSKWQDKAINGSVE
jgi:hypothetical protein